jgi:hypothetical protein
MALAVKDITLTCTQGAGTAVNFECSTSQAEFVPTAAPLEAATLCGPVSAAGRTKWAFTLGGLQDWEIADSLADFLCTNDTLKGTVEMSWPEATFKWTADVTFVACSIGGTADALAVFSVSLPVDGAPVKAALP